MFKQVCLVAGETLEEQRKKVQTINIAQPSTNVIVQPPKVGLFQEKDQFAPFKRFLYWFWLYSTHQQDCYRIRELKGVASDFDHNQPIFQIQSKHGEMEEDEWLLSSVWIDGVSGVFGPQTTLLRLLAPVPQEVLIAASSSSLRLALRFPVIIRSGSKRGWKKQTLWSVDVWDRHFGVIVCLVTVWSNLKKNLQLKTWKQQIMSIWSHEITFSNPEPPAFLYSPPAATQLSQSTLQRSPPQFQQQEPRQRWKLPPPPCCRTSWATSLLRWLLTSWPCRPASPSFQTCWCRRTSATTWLVFTTTSLWRTRCFITLSLK